MEFLNYIKNSFHRNLLEKLLFTHRKIIEGKILDIGSQTRRYDYLFNGEVTAIDIIPDSNLKIMKGDILNLQFEANLFDSVICIEVFEYLEPDNFKKGFEEIFRVLKKNGRAIITIPFYLIEHKDNYRLSYQYLLTYLNTLNQIEFKIIRFGNTYSSIYDSIRYKLLRRKHNLLRKAFAFSILFFLYSVIKWFGLIIKQDLYPSGLFIIISKR